MNNSKTISALATGEGGAIAVIRVSGANSVTAVDSIFTGIKNKKLEDQKGFTVHYGFIKNSVGEVVDDVIVTLFKAPNSYTGEDMVEISCHASGYIKNEILRLLAVNGVDPAGAGEFTLRAFMNGKLDLSQAEAVADIIASESKVSHDLAVNQIRGGYSEEIGGLRAKLIELLSLLELELDFSEEDVEFADRRELKELVQKIEAKILSLKDSFALGNILKNGIPVAIVGNPNAGKSTLLNKLLNEDKALVSDIPGTTRDLIEDSVNINGVQCRFIDTAGIRETEDMLENMGIKRTFESIGKASVILLVCDIADADENILKVLNGMDLRDNQHTIVVLNKNDKYKNAVSANRITGLKKLTNLPVITVSAKYGIGIDELKQMILSSVGYKNVIDYSSNIIVTNSRHSQALSGAVVAIDRVLSGLDMELSGDLLAEDLRTALHYLSEITGDITSEDILKSIFANFCIGK
ncbi:MAG: tRNA uridine-5-carboxymethylaminomethyl(34) synthesis GTPase MnmE [Rikenellaceae bacterium]|nr:tRNA uridine-5-carboxymethylaminomethyl(34) synthesis GTPase MnmE [Rikenellaceae bacterium]